MKKLSKLLGDNPNRAGASYECASTDPVVGRHLLLDPLLPDPLGQQPTPHTGGVYPAGVLNTSLTFNLTVIGKYLYVYENHIQKKGQLAIITQ